MDLSRPITAVIPSLEGQVLTVLAGTTMPLSGSAIADLTTGSNPGVRAALSRLVRHGTVHAMRSGASVLYTANRDHLAWPAVQAAVTNANTVHTRLEDRIRQAFVTHLDSESFDGLTVAVYGSVARGTSSVDSDVDLVAVFPDATPADSIDSVTEELATDVQRWTGNPCSVFDITAARLAQLVASGDPIVASWASEARTFIGPDLRTRLRALA